MRKCGDCGSKNLSKINLKGKQIDFLSNNKIIKDVYVLKCLNCDNLVLTGGDIDKIDRATKKD